MDIIFLIINIFWYSFTIIYFLYKFTSFFSFLYSGFKIIRHVTKSFVWIKTNICNMYERYNKKYTVLQDQNSEFDYKIDLEANQNNMYSKFLGQKPKSDTKYIPLTETDSNLLIEDMDFPFKPQPSETEPINYIIESQYDFKSQKDPLNQSYKKFINNPYI